MFAMYDDDGLKFRSTIDNLYKINDIATAQALKNDLNKEHSFKETLYKGKITKEAKEKYKKIASLDTKVEVYHTEQLMITDIKTIDETITIQECYNMLEEYNLAQLPMIDKSSKHIKRIVSRIDILSFIMADLEYTEQNLLKTVDNLPSRAIITTDPISDIRRVCKVMIDFELNAIPVVDQEDNLVGILSRADIIKAVSNLPHLEIWA